MEHMSEKEKIKTRDMLKLAAYRENLRKHPELRCLFLELTDRCNLKCRHCGSSCMTQNTQYANAGELVRLFREMPADLIDDGFMVCLTGGEPLLHPEFARIANAINDRDIPWGMTTNAVLIDLPTAFHLKELKMGSISVSIDGLMEHHEWLRRVPGCFEKAIDGIKHLHKAGHRVQVTTVVGKHNLSGLEDLYSYLQELGVESWRVINIDPIGRATDEMNVPALDRAEIKQLLAFIRRKRYDSGNRMDVRYGCAHYLSFDLEREVRDNYFMCKSGMQVASILVNGDIYGCLDVERRPELVQGNIATDRFCDVWKNGFRAYRTDRTQTCKQCSTCRERQFCAGDSMHTWDFQNNRPKICLVS